LGYKGVVGVDEQLEGIKMCLRPSMNKFGAKGSQEKEAEIEIARAFDFPNTTYLNRCASRVLSFLRNFLTLFSRPLIMVLEDRNVRKEDFVTLQEVAVADARMIDDSIEQFRKVLNAHALGNGYHLSHIMKRLNELELDIGRHATQGVDSPFFARLRRVAMNHVLRDIKHSARIPVPKSYLLVGVADEGPAYKRLGYKNVYELPAGKIYGMCIA
jgi:RNA-dependent RNA polymerase